MSASAERSRDGSPWRAHLPAHRPPRALAESPPARRSRDRRPSLPAPQRLRARPAAHAAGRRAGLAGPERPLLVAGVALSGPGHRAAPRARHRRRPARFGVWMAARDAADPAGAGHDVGLSLFGL